MKFVNAVICLLIACIPGYVAFTWGADNASVPTFLPFCLYAGIVVVTTPFWLTVFLIPFLIFQSKAVFWRFYVAPILGVLTGLLSSVILSKIIDPYHAPQDGFYYVPTMIAFTLFAVGSMVKAFYPDDDKS